MYISLRVCRGKYFERNLNIPTPCLDLEIIDLMWLSKDNLESSIIPRCLCFWTFFTGISLKKNRPMIHRKSLFGKGHLDCLLVGIRIKGHSPIVRPKLDKI